MPAPIRNRERARPFGVVLLAYRRPAHLQRVLDALRTARVPAFTVSMDAPADPAGVAGSG